MGADRTSTRHSHRPPRLLLLVFAASLALISATAVAVTAVVNTQIAEGTVNAVGDADQTLANYFIAQNRLAGPGAVIAGAPTISDTAPYVDQVDAQLGQMVGSAVPSTAGASSTEGMTAGLLRIKVHSADGTVLFSDESSLRGTNEPDDDLQEALHTGHASSSLTTDFGAEEQDLAAAGHTSALEEYLPVTD